MSALLAPATGPRTRRERLTSPLLTIGSLGLAVLALHLRDPHAHASWGLCPSAVLGFACPGCGGLRAVNDLTNGHPLQAASSNVVFVIALPFAVAWLAWWVVARWRGTSAALPARATRVLSVLVIVVLVVFTVVRNLPVGSWLAP